MISKLLVRIIQWCCKNDIESEEKVAKESHWESATEYAWFEIKTIKYYGLQGFRKEVKRLPVFRPVSWSSNGGFTSYESINYPSNYKRIKAPTE